MLNNILIIMNDHVEQYINYHVNLIIMSLRLSFPAYLDFRFAKKTDR